jgi:hypothetical protein
MLPESNDWLLLDIGMVRLASFLLRSLISLRALSNKSSSIMVIVKNNVAKLLVR